MNPVKKYYWYGKSMLQILGVQFLLYIMAFGVLSGLLDFLGAGAVIKAITLIPLFLGFLVWTGLKLRANPPPSELDILATQEDTPEAATIVELLEGNPSIKKGNVDTLVSRLVEGTKTPGKRNTFWSRLDCGTGEVYERLFGLYSQHGNAELLLVIERLTRDAPLEATAYEDTLIEELDRDREDEFIGIYAYGPQPSAAIWTIPALILGHISREVSGIAERAAPRIIELLDPQGEQRELYAVLALGELAAHDDSAKAKIREIRDSRVKVLRAAASEILAHYENSDHPYPTGQDLDEFDVKNEESRLERDREVRRSGRDKSDWWYDDEW